MPRRTTGFFKDIFKDNFLVFLFYGEKQGVPKYFYYLCEDFTISKLTYEKPFNIFMDGCAARIVGTKPCHPQSIFG